MGEMGREVVMGIERAVQVYIPSRGIPSPVQRNGEMMAHPTSRSFCSQAYLFEGVSKVRKVVWLQCQCFVPLFVWDAEWERSWHMGGCC